MVRTLGPLDSGWGAVGAWPVRAAGGAQAATEIATTPRMNRQLERMPVPSFAESDPNASIGRVSVHGGVDGQRPIRTAVTGGGRRHGGMRQPGRSVVDRHGQR